MISECSNHDMCIVVYEGRNCPYCEAESAAVKQAQADEETINDQQAKIDQMEADANHE